MLKRCTGISPYTGQPCADSNDHGGGYYGTRCRDARELALKADQTPEETVKRIRSSLQARLEGRNEGGDIEVMRLVDEIVKKATKDLLALVPKPRRSHIDMLSDDPFSHKDH